MTSLTISDCVSEAMSVQTLQSRREETWLAMSDAARRTCGRPFFDKLYENFEQSKNKCSVDLTPVIRALKSALLSKRPHQKCAVGRGSGTFLTVLPLMPVWLADRLIHSLNSVGDSKPAALITQQQQQ